MSNESDPIPLPQTDEQPEVDEKPPETPQEATEGPGETDPPKETTGAVQSPPEALEGEKKPDAPGHTARGLEQALRGPGSPPTETTARARRLRRVIKPRSQQ